LQPFRDFYSIRRQSLLITQYLNFHVAWPAINSISSASTTTNNNNSNNNNGNNNNNNGNGRSSLVHSCLKRMSFFVRNDSSHHQPTVPLHILHSISIMEPFISNLTDLKLVILRGQVHSLLFCLVFYLLKSIRYYHVVSSGYIKNRELSTLHI